jgi:hypothetical protein
MLSLVKNPPHTNLKPYGKPSLRWMNEESPAPETVHLKSVFISNEYAEVDE